MDTSKLIWGRIIKKNGVPYAFLPERANIPAIDRRLRDELQKALNNPHAFSIPTNTK